MLLGFLLQRECNLHQEEGLYFPAVFSADLNLLLLIYIGLGFCSTNYVFFLGVPASEIENNRQNTEADNFFGQLGVEEHSGQKSCTGSRELVALSAKVLSGRSGAVFNNCSPAGFI